MGAGQKDAATEAAQIYVEVIYESASITESAVSPHLQVAPDLSRAKKEISITWEQYKTSTIRHFKDGLEFGRVCHE